MKFRSSYLFFLGMLIFLYFAFTLRMYLASQQAFEIAEQAIKDGQVREALDEYQYAMRAYAPFLSTPRLAAQRLKAYAETQQQVGNHHQTLQALDRLRGGILSTRSLYMPFEDLLEDCNEKIAVIRAKEAFEIQQANQQVHQSFEDQLTHHRNLLKIIPGPTPLGSIWVSLSWIGWILFSVIAIFRSFDRELNIVDWRYLGIALVFCLNWLVALKFV